MKSDCIEWNAHFEWISTTPVFKVSFLFQMQTLMIVRFTTYKNSSRLGERNKVLNMRGFVETVPLVCLYCYERISIIKYLNTWFWILIFKEKISSKTSKWRKLLSIVIQDQRRKIRVTHKDFWKKFPDHFRHKPFLDAYKGVDDAFALQFLLNSKSVEVLAITT